MKWINTPKTCMANPKTRLKHIYPLHPQGSMKIKVNFPNEKRGIFSPFFIKFPKVSNKKIGDLVIFIEAGQI